ncbi:hypothetical protein NKH19_10725 [Mesorhizobium sp. M1338]|uniref:hypothetical protein n=1 Tax=unclassified Mesorhizobium TaxID=325217 RepID=UPI00333A57D5
MPEAEFKRHALVEPAGRVTQGYAEALEIAGLEGIIDGLEQAMALASIFRDFQHRRDPEVAFDRSSCSDQLPFESWIADKGALSAFAAAAKLPTDRLSAILTNDGIQADAISRPLFAFGRAVGRQ